MKYKQGQYPIISKRTLAKEIYDMTILCPEIAEIAKAGQFVNVKADGFMLRRPISICCLTAIDTANAVADILSMGKNIDEMEMIDITKI